MSLIKDGALLSVIATFNPTDTNIERNTSGHRYFRMSIYTQWKFLFWICDNTRKTQNILVKGDFTNKASKSDTGKNTTQYNNQQKI